MVNRPKLVVKVAKRHWNYSFGMLGLFCSVLLFVSVLSSPDLAQAACANTADATKGTDSQTINVTTSGTYYVWSRLLAPSPTNNSYYLQIDGGCAIDVGDSSTIPANSWTWVNYQDGTTTSITSVNLAAGTHQLLMTGREPGVGIDKVLFLSDSACVPTGAGDNCTPTPDNPPTTPSGLVSSSKTSSSVSLTWNASSDTDTTPVAGYNIYRNGSKVGTSTTTSYADTGLSPSTSYSYTVSAYDTAGITSVQSAPLSITTAAATVSESAYPSGAPWAIPGTIEAENYDNGGEGVAYHDNDTANIGGAYRPSEGVDTQVTSSPEPAGYIVGWTNGGEWLKYTVNVSASGSYSFRERVASPVTTGSFHMEVDGVNKTGTISVPNTGGWQTYTTLTQDGISLSAGQHVIRLYIENAGLNLNWLQFAKTDTTAPTVAITSPANGSTLTAPATTITAAATDPDSSVSTIQILLDGTLLTQCNSTNSCSTPWNNTFVNNGSHTITATATDPSNNKGSASSTVTVKITDSTAPTTPSNLTAAPSTPTSVRLSWSPSTDPDGPVAGYYVLRGGVVIASVTGTSYTDSTVTANTNYTYSVEAFDAAKNVSPPTAGVNVATPSATDTTAPTAPPNLAASAISTHQINLSWNASIDPAAAGQSSSGLAGYRIYRSIGTGTTAFSQIAQVSAATTTYGDATLSTGITYSYYVVAYDQAGNVSTHSNQVSAATPATISPSTLGKTIVGARCDNASGDYKRVNSYSLSSTATASQLTVYLKPSGTVGAQPFRGIIYADSSGVPGKLIAVTDQLTFSNTNAAGWYSLPFASPPTLTSGKYWIGTISGLNGGIGQVCYDYVSSQLRYTGNNTYTRGATNPFGSYHKDTKQMSGYITLQ